VVHAPRPSAWRERSVGFGAGRRLGEETDWSGGSLRPAAESNRKRIGTVELVGGPSRGGEKRWK
jgi:hypothetical protein